MILKYIKISFFFLLASVNAQNEITDTITIKNSVVDSIKTQLESRSLTIKKDTVFSSKKEQVSLKESDTIIKDSLQFAFLKLKEAIKQNPDHSYASKVDSLWLKDLYSNDLYDSLNHIRKNLKADTIYYPELPKDTLIARLKKLNDRTPFHIEYNPILESVIKRFLKNRQQSIERLMALSTYYFPHFEKELDAHNMPLEIKYLAIVESALNPRAKSRVGATGLWQFMYATGKEHGLDVNSYVDERSDIDKSTKAACEYLTKVYNRFGDWDLALASYNSGPGNVSKAIRRSGGNTNYWNIRPFLPRETAGYVPIFQATMYVFEYAKEHNFRPQIPEIQYFEVDTVHVKKKISLQHVADVLEIKIEDLQFMNPSYKMDVIPVIKGEDYLLRLPKTHIGKFVTHEAAIYDYAFKEFDKREKPLPELVKTSNRIRYKVRSGDFLGKIANRYGVKVSAIKRWNGLRSNNLKIGQRLIIYPNHPEKVVSKQSNKKSSAKMKTAGSYKVKQGDTLYGIAKKYSGISADNIKTYNNLANAGLKPGMILKIPKG
jgi:membrane-bound lytic murein transglycosylase D